MWGAEAVPFHLTFLPGPDEVITAQIKTFPPLPAAIPASGYLCSLSFT